MSDEAPDRKAVRPMFKAHPWHGVPLAQGFPQLVTAYIEIVPTDTVKYEMDKESGILKVDRPQRFSNVCPSPYGFVPQTLCAEEVAELMARRTGMKHLVGDGDPLDLCVLTEKVIPHGDILLIAVPIGGLSMLDGEQADDKIVAVLREDATYGDFHDISDCPPGVIERLRHYFLTYKGTPGSRNPCKITHIYGREEAHRVVQASHADYRNHFSDLGEPT
jgi:inorganic pyrophosphatase